MGGDQQAAKILVKVLCFNSGAAEMRRLSESFRRGLVLLKKYPDLQRVGNLNNARWFAVKLGVQQQGRSLCVTGF